MAGESISIFNYFEYYITFRKKTQQYFINCIIIKRASEMKNEVFHFRGSVDNTGLIPFICYEFSKERIAQSNY